MDTIMIYVQLLYLLFASRKRTIACRPNYHHNYRVHIGVYFMERTIVSVQVIGES
jgi:hypothetical protein